MLSARAFVMSETQTKPGVNALDFKSLNLSPSLLEKLDRLGFVTPTPIQAQAIPPLLEDRDVIGIAQTGTGKTLAFGLPMAERLRQGEMALVLAPTRELAIQIEEVLNKLSLKTALLIGGAPMGKQIAMMRARPTVIVATPGRLLDHLKTGSVFLGKVAIVVLDEADRMLDMGFAPDVKRILDKCPLERQTMLFSATIPKEINDLAQQYLHEPVRIEVDRSGTAATDVEQQLLIVQKEDKPAMLGDLLAQHKGTGLVFARTRHGARKLARAVRMMGHSAAEIHSDRTLPQRKAALQGFKTGMYRVLVATDIAARGIDVKDISLVVNFDVPEKAEDYIHRIGRTGRAGASGLAITLATPEQHADVRDIEKLLRKELPLSKHSPLRLERPKHVPTGRKDGPTHGRRRANAQNRFRNRYA